MTQKEQVLSHLRQYKSISSWRAIESYGITRLAEMIRQLRHDDKLNITGQTMKNDRTHWTEYHLCEEVRQDYKTLPNGQMSLI